MTQHKAGNVAISQLWNAYTMYHMCFNESTNPMVWYIITKGKLSAIPICRLQLVSS